MTTWFTSDSHFHHGRGRLDAPLHPGQTVPTGILRWQERTRPFATIADMNDALLKNVNDLVGRKDVLWHLGDFCWANARTAAVRMVINCSTVHLIRGNHEGKGVKGLEKIFSGVWDLREIEVSGQAITLCHYAMRHWNKSHYGSWNLHGHSHGSLFDDPKLLQVDVGVDCWGLRPVSFEQVQERMKTKAWEPVDHHGGLDCG